MLRQAKLLPFYVFPSAMRLPLAGIGWEIARNVGADSLRGPGGVFRMKHRVLSSGAEYPARYQLMFFAVSGRYDVFGDWAPMGALFLLDIAPRSGYWRRSGPSA